MGKIEKRSASKADLDPVQASHSLDKRARAVPSQVPSADKHSSTPTLDIRPQEQDPSEEETSDFEPSPAFVPAQAEIKIPKTAIARSAARRLLVVLSEATLESYKLSKGSSAKDDKYALLNCDDHQAVLRRLGREAAHARPDITHQCLLTLLDSPLNKAGLLQVYIRTAKGVLIELHPSVRIPRTFKRFSGLIGLSFLLTSFSSSSFSSMHPTEAP